MGCERGSRSMFDEYGALPEVASSWANSSSEVSSRPPPLPARKAASLSVARLAIVLSVVAAATFLISFCYRRAREGFLRGQYHRGLSDASGSSPGSGGESNEANCSGSSAETADQEGEEDSQPAQQTSQTPIASDDSKPADQGRTEQKPDDPFEGTSSSTTSSGSGDASETPAAADSPPPRKRKRKLKHLESGDSPVFFEPLQPPDPRAPPPSDQPPTPQPPSPAAEAAAGAAEGAVAGPSQVSGSPLLRLSGLNVLARITAQAVNSARSNVSEEKVDQKGFVFLVKILHETLVKETHYARTHILPTAPEKRNYKNSVDFAERMSKRAADLLSTCEIPPGSAEEEEEASELKHAVVNALLRSACLGAQLRFYRQSCFERGTPERWKQLRDLHASCRSIEGEVRPLLQQIRGSLLQAARELLETEFKAFMEELRLAEEALLAKEAEEEGPQEGQEGKVPGPEASLPKTRPLPKKPEKPRGKEPLKELVQNMLHLSQSLESAIVAYPLPHTPFQQAVISALVQQAMDEMDKGERAKQAAFDEGNDPSEVLAAMLTLQDAIRRALEKQ
ncbi:hypothetical protein Efla_002080 [Eimeria flavescens]